MIGNNLQKTPMPVSPELSVLFAQERDYSPATEMIRARLMSRARQAVSTPRMPVPERRFAWPGRRLAYAAAAGLAMMAGVAAAYELLARPAPAPAKTEATVRHLAKPAQPAPVEPAAPQVSAEVAETPAVSPTESDSPRRNTSGSKNEARLKEIRLLVRARQADARRDYATVLTIAAEHERNFPGGRLSEERQVLRVKALVGLGWADEARRVGASFGRQFPHSVLRQTVDEMLASIR
jgi:hypothetical protein